MSVSTQLIAASISDQGDKPPNSLRLPKTELLKLKLFLPSKELYGLQSLMARFNLRKGKEKFKLNFPVGDAVDLQHLTNEYNTLCKIENELILSKEKLAIKQYKLHLLKAVEKHLHEKILFNKKIEEKKRESFLKKMFRKAVFGVLLISGLAMDGIASFLGVQEILAFVSAFSSPVSLALGIFFCFVNSAMFYSFEAGLLKKALHIEAVNDKTIQYDIDEEEIEITKRINEMMMGRCANKLDPSAYAAFATISGSFNKNVMAKKEGFKKEPSENKFRKAFRHGITAIGAIMQVSSGYFLAASLLAFIAAPLLGTPIGWAIIGFGMITYLAFFLSMRGKAVLHMFNPEIEKFQHVKSKLDDFKGKSEQDLRQHFKVKNVARFHLEAHYKEDNKLEKREAIEKSSIAFRNATDTTGLEWKRTAPGKWAVTNKDSERANPLEVEAQGQLFSAPIEKTAAYQLK